MREGRGTSVASRRTWTSSSLSRRSSHTPRPAAAACRNACRTHAIPTPAPTSQSARPLALAPSHVRREVPSLCQQSPEALHKRADRSLRLLRMRSLARIWNLGTL